MFNRSGRLNSRFFHSTGWNVSREAHAKPTPQSSIFGRTKATTTRRCRVVSAVQERLHRCESVGLVFGLIALFLAPNLRWMSTRAVRRLLTASTSKPISLITTNLSISIQPISPARSSLSSRNISRSRVAARIRRRQRTIATSLKCWADIDREIWPRSGYATTGCILLTEQLH
jgi:hypothetical protein